MISRILTFPHRFALRADDLAPSVFQAQQVHGRQIVLVGRESNAQDIRARECDALLASHPGIRVGVRTADCVPILVEDPTRSACAAIHAGWRGLLAGVIEETVSSFSDARDLRAAIGPSIGPCCFEVGPEVAERFPGFVTQRTKAHVDLQAAAHDILERLGVREIDTDLAACTRCDPRGFYSYRRDGAGTKSHLHYIGVP